MNDRRAPWVVLVSLVSLACFGVASCRAHAPAAIDAPPPPPVSSGNVIVHGVVTDETGAALPGATVAVMPVATGIEHRATTDVQGQYRLLVPFGDLRLTAELSGFKKVEMRAMPVPGKAFEWSPRLGLGAMAETLTVTAELSQVSTKGRDRSRARSERAFNTEAYAYRKDSDFREVSQAPLSTFSVDVDRASYANLRRFLNEGGLPPADAVRIEEMLNYFPYEYAPPADGQPFAAHVEIAPAPWKAEHRLVRIGLKAHEVTRADRPASNLVFLIDVSGSMDYDNKLPLVQRALGLLVDQLDERDRVGIVVYAGAAGQVLAPTTGDQKPVIRDAIDSLRAGGSTNGAQGIQLAYELAARNLVEGGTNRVILATDGDFNVGVTDEGSLVRLVQDKAKAGIHLTVLGFGMGNYKDATLEALADKGDGNYAYIDTLLEARKALVEELTATLVTVAKDVKIQVEWNPVHVRAYRLIGYENRLLSDEDFNDDAKDAGEVGAGHQVTALYEIVPPTAPSPASNVDPLVFSKPRQPTSAAGDGDILRLKLRYKAPTGGRSRKLEWPVRDAHASLDAASADFQFASAVAAFGMLLRQSPHRGAATSELVARLGERGKGTDRHGYRAEFLSLVAKAEPRLVRSAAAGAQ